MKSSAALLVLCVISGLVLLRAPAAVEAAACNPSGLTACSPAITGSKPPTKACCSALMSQSSCFCTYLKNPSLAKYVSGGKKIATACGITLPNC